MVAGNGIDGFSGDGGAAVNASLSFPADVAMDRFGTLYIADSGNNRIRKVTPDGIITTIAGTGRQGFGGDNGPALTALLDTPTALAVDALGNLFLYDSGNYRIRKIGTDGTIRTVAEPASPDISGKAPPCRWLPMSPDNWRSIPKGIYISPTSTVLTSGS